MKTNKHLTILLLLLMSSITMQAQQEVVKDSENVIIMSEDDIISLAMKLRALKKDYLTKMSLNIPDSSKSKINTLDKNSFEVDYLRSRIVVLENQIKGYEVSNNTSKPKPITSANNSNSLNQSELNSMKEDISQLKDLVRQLVIKTNDDLTVVMPLNQLETEAKIVPTDTIVKEEMPVVNNEKLVLKNKLDSLTVLFKNFKESDYSGDFAALEKRITALKKELALKNAAPTSYDNLIKEYKGYNRSIYFANNSTDLNEESTKVVDELYNILDKNDNIDIFVKGFASNKGDAIYNENLSMMRTESVKKALILKGIQPIRILSEYHGIDYNAKAEKARRVEISILVRK